MPYLNVMRWREIKNVFSMALLTFKNMKLQPEHKKLTYDKVLYSKIKAN